MFSSKLHVVLLLILIIYNGFLSLSFLSAARFTSILGGLYFAVKCIVYYRMLRYGAENGYVTTLWVFIILGILATILFRLAFPKQNRSQGGFFNLPDIGNIIRKVHFIFGVVLPGIILITIKPLKNA